MSRDQQTQPLTSDVEQHASPVDTSDRRLKVGEPLPAACDVHDLAKAFGKSTNTIYNWSGAGKLRRYELSRPFGTRRWSGKLIQAALDGPMPLVAVKRRA